MEKDILSILAKNNLNTSHLENSIKIHQIEKNTSRVTLAVINILEHYYQEQSSIDRKAILIYAKNHFEKISLEAHNKDFPNEKEFQARIFSIISKFVDIYSLYDDFVRNIEIAKEMFKNIFRFFRLYLRTEDRENFIITILSNILNSVDKGIERHKLDFFILLTEASLVYILVDFIEEKFAENYFRIYHYMLNYFTLDEYRNSQDQATRLVASFCVFVNQLLDILNKQIKLSINWNSNFNVFYNTESFILLYSKFLFIGVSVINSYKELPNVLNETNLILVCFERGDFLQMTKNRHMIQLLTNIVNSSNRIPLLQMKSFLEFSKFVVKNLLKGLYVYIQTGNLVCESISNSPLEIDLINLITSILILLGDIVSSSNHKDSLLKDLQE